VNFINEAGGYIEWTVSISSAADADCSLVFTNGGADRGMEVRVNGNVSLAECIFPGTGDWTIWSEASLVLGLQTGDNTIRLTSTGSEGGPNLDRLDITPGTYLPDKLFSFR
jgi:hypothetical protein